MNRLALLFTAAVITLPATAAEDLQYQLHLERAARILAASYANLHPEADPFEGAYRQNIPADIIGDERPIAIQIEHAISDQREMPIFIKGIKQYRDWLAGLKSGDRDHYGFEVRTLGVCDASSGCCNFPFVTGISHNHLYLQRACFTSKDQLPVLATIYLYDGD